MRCQNESEFDVEHAQIFGSADLENSWLLHTEIVKKKTAAATKKGNVFIKTINLSFQQKSLRILDFVIEMENLWNTEIIWIQNENSMIGSYVRNRKANICDHFNSTDIENKCLQAPELRGGNLSNLASTRTFSCLNQSIFFVFTLFFLFQSHKLQLFCLAICVPCLIFNYST